MSFLWYSERSDYGQMYLYDLTTGKLKDQITHGDGPLTQVLHVDDKNRVLYFLACGKEPGRDPYFTNYYRVSFDGSGQQLLTPENADHAITPSADGTTFVDDYSTVDTPRTTVLRDNTGKVLVGPGQAGHLCADGEGMEARNAHYSEGPRWQDATLRVYVPADKLRYLEEVSGHRLCVSRSANGLLRLTLVFFRAW